MKLRPELEADTLTRATSRRTEEVGGNNQLGSCKSIASGDTRDEPFESSPQFVDSTSARQLANCKLTTTEMIHKQGDYSTHKADKMRRLARRTAAHNLHSSDLDGQGGRGQGDDEQSSDSFVSLRPCSRWRLVESGDLGRRHTKLEASTRHNEQQARTPRWTPPIWCKPSLLALLMLIVNSANFLPAAEGVDCFKCSSRNGSNPLCEDPFHNTNTTRVTTPILPEPHPKVIYHTPCYAGKKGRDGLFPASACIKLTGIFDKTGETLVVRHCALDSGSLTQDTELARMSHCGKFQFEGDLLRGCVLACPEDACNSASSLTQILQSKNGQRPLIMWLFSMFLSVCFMGWP